MECYFECGDPIDPNSRFTWHHMEGWERPGNAGGSDIKNRKRTGKGIAHDVCLQREKDGVSAQQQTLV